MPKLILPKLIFNFLIRDFEDHPWIHLFLLAGLVLLALFILPDPAEAQGPYDTPQFPWAAQGVQNFNYGVTQISRSAYGAGYWGYNQAYSWGAEVYGNASRLWNSGGGPLANAFAGVGF